MLWLTTLTLLGAVYWAYVCWAMLRVARRIPSLSGMAFPAPARWPKISLIIPARNEGLVVAKALRSKLACHYPDLEVVFVNDRSTDDTGQVADALAAQEPRLQVVHVSALPPGWLGKLNAMREGLERASGDWILFSDADVHIEGRALEKVVAYAEAKGFDHIAIGPSITCRGPLLDPTMGAFFRVISVIGRIWAVSDPKSSSYIGVGAFNLFRRPALAKTAGLESLRMEIADDMALGMMLKRSGARQQLVNGDDEVWLEFYPSFRAMLGALEKGGATFPFPIFAFVVLALAALELGPLWGLASESRPLIAVALGTWLVGSLASLVCTRLNRLSRWPACVPWLGMVFLGFGLLRSAVLALARGGVQWRGTFYSTREIRAGVRIRFG